MRLGVVIMVVFLSALIGLGSFNFYAIKNRENEGSVHRVGEAKQIHLSWSGDPRTTMTVMWHTDSNDNPNTAQYGLTASYELGNVSGYSYPSPFSGYWHVVKFTALQPGTTYHYRVSGDNGSSQEWSGDHTFTTAPSTPVDFSFVACGDSRQALPYPYGNLDGWKNVVNAIKQQNGISFVLFTGDMCYDGNTEPYWNDWFNIAENISSYIPLIPAIGNHETSGDSSAHNYLGEFTLPGNELWFSFNYSTAHFIVLSTENTTDVEQINWLKNDLSYAANDSMHPWKIVVFHKPPYTSTSDGHGPDTDVQNYWVPLFDRYHVDLVFNGHNHFYQRTYPLIGGENPSNPTVTTWEKKKYVNPQGTIYVVSGAAGAPTIGYDPDNNSGYIAYYLGHTNHFTRIDIYTNNSLHLLAIKDTGEVFDDFWIVKTQVPEMNLIIVLLFTPPFMACWIRRK